MNQPPGIGSWGPGLSRSLSVGDATRGVSLPGKTSEQDDKMASERVWTSYDPKRTSKVLERFSDVLDDHDHCVHAMMEVQRECGSHMHTRLILNCSLLYDDVKSSPDNVRYFVEKGHDEATFDAYCNLRVEMDDMEASLVEAALTRSTMAKESSPIESGDETLSDDIDDAFDDNAPEALERFVMNGEASEYPSMLGDVREQCFDGTSPWNSKSPFDIDVGERDVNTSDMHEGAPLIPDGTTLTTTGTTGQSLDTGTVNGNYGDPPSPTVVDEHARRAAWKHDLSDETQLPDSVGSTISHVMGPLLQCDDSTNHLSCSGTQRGTHTDCSYPTVGNVFDFDDPSDRNLSDGTRRPISDIDVNRLSTVNSHHSLDPKVICKTESV